MAENKHATTVLTCYHCGEECKDEDFVIEEKHFCCFGCQTVYEILQDNDMCAYYDMSTHPGVNRRVIADTRKYAVLDDEQVRTSFVHFSDGTQSHVTFYLPAMHCSSCIWLLEHLHKLGSAIISSRVDFPKKEVRIVFLENEIALSKVAMLCDSVGYEPLLSLSDLEQKPERSFQRKRLIKIGIAGFAFGNVMMLAFPEYLSGAGLNDPALNNLFRMIALVLSIPVFFYCADEFYISSWKSLKNKYLNIDVPIALAIIITFFRSLYAVFVEHGAGYFDTMNGIVFFMLVGRYFQDLTYKTISFDRDYKSYFPLSVSVVKKGEEAQKPLSALENGDIIVVRNQELIPADALLIKGKGQIDYSFVTGESEPVDKRIGDLVYAGGRQVGAAIELKVVKEVSQSYLTQLWNNIDVSRKDDEKQSFVQILGRYFALIVLVISTIAFAYWLLQGDMQRALDALITPMIVACPCALLLSATFTNGNAIRYFGKFGIYLKNAFVIEKMTKTDAIVFDKTGTLTQSNTTSTAYTGETLSADLQHKIAVVAAQSTHPYSKAIARYLGNTTLYGVQHFTEVQGQGIEADIEGTHIQIGSSGFVRIPNALTQEHGVAYIAIDGRVQGRFTFANKYREGFESMIKSLQNRYTLYLLSGDNDADKAYLSTYFPADHMHFNQTPHDKLRFIKSLQLRHKNVMMLGDGLNDAGALQQADTGVAVAHSSNFTPASDVVMDVQQLTQLPALFSYAHTAKRVILGSFVLSIIYNVVGLYFALQGALSPVVAAILMPLSTITIVSFTTGMTTLAARWVMGKRLAE